jgi:hypothetical protein
MEIFDFMRFIGLIQIQEILSILQGLEFDKILSYSGIFPVTQNGVNPSRGFIP